MSENEGQSKQCVSSDESALKKKTIFSVGKELVAVFLESSMSNLRPKFGKE